jgi:ferritin-like metal-binding protein YciE
LKDTLKDIYYAEKQLVKALKKMGKAATNSDLREAFENHRMQTEEQIELLGQAFESLDMRAAGKNCPAMDGLIEEGREHMEEMDKGPALDAALIVGAQKVEHYEIAAYGSLKAFAKSLGLSECEEIFDQILQQESDTDELLTQVAATVNREALGDEQTMESGNYRSGMMSSSSDGMEVGEMEEQQM